MKKIFKFCRKPFLSVACSTVQGAATLTGIAGDLASLARTAVPKPQQYVYPEIEIILRDRFEQFLMTLPQTCCGTCPRLSFEFEMRSRELFE